MAVFVSFCYATWTRLTQMFCSVRFLYSVADERTSVDGGQEVHCLREYSTILRQFGDDSPGSTGVPPRVAYAILFRALFSKRHFLRAYFF